MGMFDYVRCEMPLPGSPNVGEEEPAPWQTKSFDPRCLDLYIIKEDGTLWHEAYDIEDRSDPKAKGIFKFSGSMTRVNIRLEPVHKTMEVVFYATTLVGRWVEFSAYFVDGKLAHLKRIEG